MEKIKCPYTEEMLASENQFLKHLEQFAKHPEQLELKSSAVSYNPIGALFP